MTPVTERQVGIGRAAHVEIVGPGKGRFITVGGRQPQELLPRVHRVVVLQGEGPCSRDALDIGQQEASKRQARQLPEVLDWQGGEAGAGDTEARQARGQWAHDLHAVLLNLTQRSPHQGEQHDAQCDRPAW